MAMFKKTDDLPEKPNVDNNSKNEEMILMGFEFLLPVFSLEYRVTPFSVQFSVN